MSSQILGFERGTAALVMIQKPMRFFYTRIQKNIALLLNGPLVVTALTMYFCYELARKGDSAEKVQHLVT